MVSLPRNAQIWLPGYLKTVLRTRRPARHAWLMIGDHYEPYWTIGLPQVTRTPEQAFERVRQWRTRWPEIASRHRDSDGNPPQYTFFYAEEEYHPELLDRLAEMTASGI